MKSMPNTPGDQSENNNWDIPNPSEEVNPSANEVEKHNEEYAQVLEKVIGEYENNREQYIQDMTEKAKEVAVLMDFLESRRDYMENNSPYGNDPVPYITEPVLKVDQNTGELHEDEEATYEAQMERVAEVDAYEAKIRQLNTDITKILEASTYKPAEEAKE